MRVRVAAALAGAVLVAALAASSAEAYIHFPPTTLPKMCKESHHIRVLKVERFDKEAGVVIFKSSGILKDGKSRITAFKVLLGPTSTGSKPIFDWLEKDKQAVMFSIEGTDREAQYAIAYAFIDGYCFSAVHDPAGKVWRLIRGEPGLAACYHGSAETLRGLVADVLDGKDVRVPVKGPDVKEDRDKRNKEVNDGLEKTRTRK